MQLTAQLEDKIHLKSSVGCFSLLEVLFLRGSLQATDMQQCWLDFEQRCNQYAEAQFAATKRQNTCENSQFGAREEGQDAAAPLIWSEECQEYLSLCLEQCGVEHAWDTSTAATAGTGKKIYHVHTCLTVA